MWGWRARCTLHLPSQAAVRLAWHAHGSHMEALAACAQDCQAATATDLTGVPLLHVSCSPTATFQLNLKGWDSSGAQVLPASRPSVIGALR